jgi:pyrimidine-specific ribonucleoside hydrolase
MSIPIIIDCDPGHDDAIALLLALASPEVDLLGVTTVAGNSTLDNTTVNALKVLELCDRREIQVAAGAPRPLVRDLVIADHVHGKSGLDGPDLAHPKIEPVASHAVDFLAERILGSPAPVTLIPIGPLTNIALLLSRYPEVVRKISRIISMGGAMGIGNITPSAEFNIYVDPEAAHRVYHSGLPITMIGLDVTHQALLDNNHAERLRSMGRTGRFVAELLDFFISNYPRHRSGGGAGRGGAPIHDAVAVAHVIWPDLVSTVACHVTVETQSELCRGRTVVDRWHVTSLAANAAVGVAISGDRLAELVIDRISRLG